MGKNYVDVESRLVTPDFLCPIVIHWPDGRSWKIRRVLHMTPAEAGDTFSGIRYTVLIGKMERYLYFDGNEWYTVSAEPDLEGSVRN